MAERLPQVRRKGTAAVPAWYLHDRLVARLVDAHTAVVRVPLEVRDAVIAGCPDGFGVPPAFEAHHKVEVYLGEVSDAAAQGALDAAWQFQHDDELNR